MSCVVSMNIAQLLNISDPRSNICLIICILQTKTSDYPSTSSRHLMIIQLFLEWKRTETNDDVGFNEMQICWITECTHYYDQWWFLRHLTSILRCVWCVKRTQQKREYLFCVRIMFELTRIYVYLHIIESPLSCLKSGPRNYTNENIPKLLWSLVIK